MSGIDKGAEEARIKASAMLVNALGDSALRVCISKIEEPEQMLKLLDKRYASNRAATRISVLTATLFEEVSRH